MAVRLGPHQYGKAETRVVRIYRDTPRHRIRDLNVSSALRGRFDDAHILGDQRDVLPTDTQKNTAFAFAKEKGVGAIEEFGITLGQHFLDAVPAADGARIGIEDYPWERIEVDGQGHDHAFVRTGGGVRTTVVDVDGRGADRTVQVVSGIQDLVLLKSTGSEFHGFLNDGYTTLQETDDRILATSLVARWRYDAGAVTRADVDWDGIHQSVKALLLRRFAEIHSLALQQTLYGMGEAVLERHAEIAGIEFSAPNKHHFLVDLSPFGLENPNEVFHAADRPYGLIEATVLRDDAGGRGGQPVSGLDLVVRARRVVTPEGEVAAAVGVEDGVIVAVEPVDSVLTATEVVELAADEVLMPGVVDSHVHVNDPGRTAWEGFASATRAAAAGGVTTIVDMPLNSIPPTVDVAALDVKRKTAAGQAFVDVGFWGGAVPGNVPDLRPLHEAGVLGFKCFLLHSGVDEFPPVDGAQLEAAMREIATFDGLLIVHAEDGPSIARAPACHGPRYEDFLASRPRHAEDVAVREVVDLAAATGCRAHILHVSSADALTVISEARRSGVRLSAETCPHYLSFTAEEIPDGATQYKCCPPIRESDNRELLWEGLRDGTIGTVVSDHSPSTVDLKLLERGDFGAAWGGISSLQLSLAAVWTGARTRGFSLVDVARWMCRGPADQVGLTTKGRIAVGYDADFAVLAPDATFVVDVHRLHHKNAITPYAGRELAGVVRSTWLRGERLDIDAEDIEPRGRLLTRGEA